MAAERTRDGRSPRLGAGVSRAGVSAGTLRGVGKTRLEVRWRVRDVATSVRVHGTGRGHYRCNHREGAVGLKCVREWLGPVSGIRVVGQLSGLTQCPATVPFAAKRTCSELHSGGSR